MKRIFTLTTLLLLVLGAANATITAKWDWQNNIPATIRNSVPEGTNVSGQIASDVEGVSLSYFAAVTDAYAKLQFVSGQDYAQFNANTGIRIPVVSTSDKITIKTKSGQHNYTYNGEAATEDNHTYDVSAAQVATGYVEIVSTAYMNIYSIVAEYAYMPVVKVASWTFDTGYDVDGLVYTPNTSEWEAIAQTQSKNNTAKQFVANAAYTSQSSCIATVSNDDTGNTYYSIKDNNGDKVFSLYPTSISNSVTDYTNASEHTVYYQFSFPTLGLKNIKVNLGFTYGSNAVRNMELVYSTDGGTTWVDGGACAGGSNWYTYPDAEKALDAADKASVIVRLLPANGENGDYRMNYFTVTGKLLTSSISTLSGRNYASYVTTNKLDFGNTEGITAYIATGLNSGGTAVELSPVDVVPAGTPIIVKTDTKGATVNVPVTEAAASDVSGNLLVAGDGTTAWNGTANTTYYYLASDQFHEATSGTLQSGKAYLAITSGSGAPQLSISFGGTTGISTTNFTNDTNNNGEYYNLAGQRVANPTKGLYIVNGKKVIVK